MTLLVLILEWYNLLLLLIFELSAAVNYCVLKIWSLGGWMVGTIYVSFTKKTTTTFVPIATDLRVPELSELCGPSGHLKSPLC